MHRKQEHEQQLVARYGKDAADVILDDNLDNFKKKFKYLFDGVQNHHRQAHELLIIAALVSSSKIQELLIIAALVNSPKILEAILYDTNTDVLVTDEILGRYLHMIVDDFTLSFNPLSQAQNELMLCAADLPNEMIFLLADKINKIECPSPGTVKLIGGYVETIASACSSENWKIISNPFTTMNNMNIILNLSEKIFGTTVHFKRKNIEGWDYDERNHVMRQCLSSIIACAMRILETEFPMHRLHFATSYSDAPSNHDRERIALIIANIKKSLAMSFELVLEDILEYAKHMAFVALSDKKDLSYYGNVCNDIIGRIASIIEEPDVFKKCGKLLQILVDAANEKYEDEKISDYYAGNLYVLSKLSNSLYNHNCCPISLKYWKYTSNISKDIEYLKILDAVCTSDAEHAKSVVQQLSEKNVGQAFEPENTMISFFNGIIFTFFGCKTNAPKQQEPTKQLKQSF